MKCKCRSGSPPHCLLIFCCVRVALCIHHAVPVTRLEQHNKMNHLLSLRWSDEEYWRRLCPHLTITSDGGANLAADAEHSQKDDASDKEVLERLIIDDGY